MLFEIITLLLTVSIVVHLFFKKFNNVHNFIDWLVMKSVWSMTNYSPETSIEDRLRDSSYRLVHVVPTCPTNSSSVEELSYYTQSKLTVLAPTDIYMKYRIGYVNFSLLMKNSTNDLKQIEQCLLDSLSKTLFYFPSVGGVYRELDPSVDLNLLNDFERSMFNGRRKNLLVMDHSNPKVNVMIHHCHVPSVDQKVLFDMEKQLTFVPEIKTPYSNKDLTRIQINFLQCGKEGEPESGETESYTFISLCLNHSVGGVDVGHYFLKCWSEMTKSGLISKKPSMTRYEAIKPKSEIPHDLKYTNPETQHKFHEYAFHMTRSLFTHKATCKRFVLSKSKVESLKNSIREKILQNSSNKDEKLIISTNDVICALLYRVMIHSETSQSKESNVTFRMVSNYRASCPPMKNSDKFVLVNPLSQIWIEENRQELKKLMIEELVLLIRKVVSEQYTQERTERFILETSKSFHDESVLDLCKPVIRNPVNTFSWTNWTKFDFLKSIDFGDDLLKTPEMLINFENLSSLHHGKIYSNSKETYQLVLGVTDKEAEMVQKLLSDCIIE